MTLQEFVDKGGILTRTDVYPTHNLTEEELIAMSPETELVPSNPIEVVEKSFSVRIQRQQKAYVRAVRRKAARHLTPERNQELMKDAMKRITETEIV